MSEMNVNTLFSKWTRLRNISLKSPEYGTMWYEDLYSKKKVTIIFPPYFDNLKGKEGFWAEGRDGDGIRYILYWEILADLEEDSPDKDCCDWERYEITLEDELYERFSER
jgi:hypothetical protein